MEFLEKVINVILSKKFILPIVYSVLGVIIYKLVDKLVSNIIKRRPKKNSKKEETIFDLIKNIFKYLVIIIVILMILEVYGVNTTSILASLGVVSVIIGLALQDTIKNMLSGIIIIFDDRYSIGDTVLINGFKGEVTHLGLQTTKLKAVNGEVFTINNSGISSVINYTECNTTLFIDLGVSYDTDIKKLEKVLTKLNTSVKKIDNVIGDLTLLGVENFEASQITYKVSILCKPNMYYNVKREIFKLVKETFDKEGIEIPFNQIDIHMKK